MAKRKAESECIHGGGKKQDMNKNESTKQCTNDGDSCYIAGHIIGCKREEHSLNPRSHNWHGGEIGCYGGHGYGS